MKDSHFLPYSEHCKLQSLTQLFHKEIAKKELKKNIRIRLLINELRLLFEFRFKVIMTNRVVEQRW